LFLRITSTALLTTGTAGAAILLVPAVIATPSAIMQMIVRTAATISTVKVLAILFKPAIIVTPSATIQVIKGIAEGRTAAPKNLPRSSECISGKNFERMLTKVSGGLLRLAA